MNNDIEEMVKRLSFENLIWIGFIITSALDIYGDEIIKKGLVTNDKNARKKANKLFLGISFFSILVYIYFLMRNYNDYQKKKKETCWNRNFKYLRNTPRRTSSSRVN